jgi:hypothetical protein
MTFCCEFAYGLAELDGLGVSVDDDFDDDGDGGEMSKPSMLME